MNKNIFRHEFRIKFKSVVYWSLGVMAVIFIYMPFFPTFADQIDLFNEALANFPPELRTAFGLDNADLSTVAGYFGGFVFLFTQIILSIQAANYGFGLVSIDESELTADFLLTKPVSRTQILTSKLLAAFAGLTLTNLVVWISSLAAISLFRGDHVVEWRAVFLLLGSIVIFQLFFLSVGLVVSLLVRRIRSVTPYAMGLGFGAYVLNAFSGMLGDVKLELITPFKHFDPAYIIEHGAYDMPLIVLNIGVTLVSLVASYWLYVRRDIAAVA
ncbi:MAG: hypothetical protein D6706_14005 [Chloroflexi bacterium]|nr:MAG: hypothetical protein D6706_14005 [Chloroflexota bacterium]